jgi:ferredoxin-NADP reductase
MERMRWQIAEVTAIRQETPRVKSFMLRLPDFISHRAGQHYDLRLTAADGYQTQRSYSIASAPEKVGEIEITVDRIEDGEVSTYLHDVLVLGDRVEVRGPIGGYFVWEASLGGPLLLIAGGSGVVPLMSMLRHRLEAGSRAPTRLLYSSRTFEDIIYRRELDELHARMDGLEVFHTLTRGQPHGWQGYGRRVDRVMLAEVASPLGNRARAFMCGPTAFVEAVATALLDSGIPPARIKTERFGPSGG